MRAGKVSPVRRRQECSPRQLPSSSTASQILSKGMPSAPTELRISSFWVNASCGPHPVMLVKAVLAKRIIRALLAIKKASSAPSKARRAAFSKSSA